MDILSELNELKERAHRMDLRYAEEGISKAEHDARLSEDLLAKAVAECNGDDVARALRMRDEALDSIRQAVADRRALKEKQAQSSPLAALASLTSLSDLATQLNALPQSFADAYSVNDLLDQHGIAQYLAHGWFEKNQWFATAHSTQKTIMETLHHTLRAQNLGVHQSAYWDALTGLVGHLKLDSFVLPAQEKQATVPEKILAIMQGLVDTITAPREQDAPVRKHVRVRKKAKSAATLATPVEKV